MSFYKRLINKIKKELVRLKKGRLEIILYHFVSSEENVFIGSGHNVKPEVFREQIKYLSEKYKIIPLAKAREVILGSDKGGPYASVCFDDGYLSNIKEAYPILEEFKIPATMFICPSVLDNQDILWRDKIRYIINNNLVEKFLDFLKQSANSKKYDFTMLPKKSFYAWSKKETAIKDMSIQEDLNNFFKLNNINAREIAEKYDLYIGEKDIKEYKYLEFGNHTWSHPLMSCLNFFQQGKEIKETHEYLEKRGIRPFALSLPFAPYNADTVKLCRELNYEFILNVSDEGNAIGKGKEDFLVLHRKMAPATLKGLKKMI